MGKFILIILAGAFLWLSLASTFSNISNIVIYVASARKGKAINCKLDTTWGAVAFCWAVFFILWMFIIF